MPVTSCPGQSPVRRRHAESTPPDMAARTFISCSVPDSGGHLGADPHLPCAPRPGEGGWHGGKERVDVVGRRAATEAEPQ